MDREAGQNEEKGWRVRGLLLLVVMIGGDASTHTHKKKKREKEGRRGEEMREEKESDFLLLRLSVCLSVCDVRRLLVLAL